LSEDKSLQEIYAPENRCFGCGPANKNGLQIRSFVEGETLVARWRGEKRHEAFSGFLNGGIISTLLDCHCNWTATYWLMKTAGSKTPPCTVTAGYSIKFLAPTPSDREVKLVGRVIEGTKDRATVEGSLISGETTCATFRGTFVAVQPGHPAYHRW
jgi:acyl-coenzyme A thioesterase PaaI-like protein